MTKNILLVVSVALMVTLGFIIVAKMRKSRTPIQTSVEKQVVTPTKELPADYQIPLSIDKPSDKTTTTDATITLKGATVPKASVFVNDIELTADLNGDFQTQVDLESGENAIVVVANDEQGNYSEREITVTYESSSGFETF